MGYVVINCAPVDLPRTVLAIHGHFDNPAAQNLNCSGAKNNQAIGDFREHSKNSISSKNYAWGESSWTPRPRTLGQFGPA